MNNESQCVFILFGRYTPEPHIAGVFNTEQEAWQYLNMMIAREDVDRYEIVQEYIWRTR